jgi:serine protease Do
VELRVKSIHNLKALLVEVMDNQEAMPSYRDSRISPDASSSHPPFFENRTLSADYAADASVTSRSRDSRSPGESASGAASGLGVMLFAMLAVSLAWFLGPALVSRYQYATTSAKIRAGYDEAGKYLEDMPLNNISTAFQMVAQRIRPSVVSIIVSENQPERSLTSGGEQGSGVIMSADGYILTNSHVVQTARFVKVRLEDRREYDGEVVGQDPTSDLAVIKIRADNLLPAKWGDSDALEVGTMVWAVGSPYGLDQTITSGILSAKERGSEVLQAKEYLQTDAAINPGNSGGPLVNSRGEVVGINTYIYGETFLGISFAVPSSIARFVFDQIVSEGKVTRGYLGVAPRPVAHDDMIRDNLPDLNGAVVESIPKNGPASASDLRRGDVIRRWNGQEVKQHNVLYRLIGKTRPGSSAEVEIIRNGKPMTIMVEVGNKDDYPF